MTAKRWIRCWLKRRHWLIRGRPGGSLSLFHAQARPELALDLLVIEPPFPPRKFVVVGAGEKADGDLKASRLAPAAAVIAPCLRPAERLLQKGVRVERLLLRTQTADNHFAPTPDDQSVNNRRVDVLFGKQKVGSLRNRVSVFVAQVADAGEAVVVTHDAGS